MRPEARNPVDELSNFALSVRRRASEAGPLEGFFDASRDVLLARAPARLDVMGGIADYSGSLVLELPLFEGVLAAAQRAEDGVVRLASVARSGSEPPRSLTLAASELAAGYDAARERFAKNTDDAWGAYVGGALVALAERGVALRGARLLISSSVPEGKGVASSAAVLVAAMTAASAALEVPIEPGELALACQKVENLVAGAPSGVMDPMAATLGEENELLELLCQPALVRGHVPIPAGVRLYGIDSGVRHATSGKGYGGVRVAAFMGYRILADRLGFAWSRRGDGVVVDDPKFGGYLANVPRDVFERHEAALPETLGGADFLARYGGTTDSVTRVDPEGTYPVRAATRHPILEHERVRAFATELPNATEASTLGVLGELMRASHASYSACGLGSDGTDELVELVRRAGPGDGLFGAKITGGGSGGTVAVLAAAGADDAVERVAHEYEKRSGRRSLVFRGSSPGAAAFGAYRLRPKAARPVRI